MVEHRFCKPAVAGSIPVASLEGRCAVVAPQFLESMHSRGGPCEYFRLFAALAANSAGVAQLVERQPSKLNVVGSNPIARLSR